MKIFKFFNKIDENYQNNNYFIKVNGIRLGFTQDIEKWFINHHEELSEIHWEYILVGDSDLPEFWDGYCLDIEKLKMR